MKPWIAILSLAEDGRLAISQEFDEEAGATAHVDQFKESYPGAMYASNPGANPIDLRVVDGVLVVEPIPVPEPAKFPSAQELMDTIATLRTRLDKLEGGRN
jgi:hypothetical protein